MTACSEYLRIRQNIILLSTITVLGVVLVSTGLSYHIAVQTVSNFQQEMTNQVANTHHSTKKDLKEMLSMVLESTNFTNTGIEENHVDRFENMLMYK